MKRGVPIYGVKADTNTNEHVVGIIGSVVIELFFGLRRLKEYFDLNFKLFFRPMASKEILLRTRIISIQTWNGCRVKLKRNNPLLCIMYT